MFRRVQYTDYLLVYNETLNTSEVIEARKAPHTSPTTVSRGIERCHRKRDTRTRIHKRTSYFDAYRSKKLPTNIIQAQRDYFGAHTYERIDQEGIFHTLWD